MKISHRLYLTVLPAALAVLLLAALTYWGQYARTAPELVLVIAAIAIALGKSPGPPDEIDEIERVVDRLSNAIEIAEVKSADREQLFERRAHDYALLLASIADASTKRLEEVRLPLHILLDNHFGELNENQEEMLGAARAAAEAADADMLSLRQIAALDLGEQPLREHRMRPSDIVDAVRPLLLSAADAAGVTLEIDVAPLLPAVKGDRALLQGALVTILRDTVASAPRDSRVRLEVSGEDAAIHVIVTGVGATSVSVRWAAAVRVVQAHAGTVNRGANELRMQLPAEGR